MEKLGTLCKFPIQMLAFLVVFALGVSAVASASAAEWLVGGVAANKAPSEGNGMLIFVDSKINLSMECSGIFDGTIGPGAADSVTEVLTLGKVAASLAAPLVCTALGGCEAAGKTEVAPEGLPWTTELTSTTTDLTVKATYWSTCRVLGLQTTEECTTENSSYKVVNVTGGVEAQGEITPLANCTVGGKESGSQNWVLGNLLTSPSGTVSIA
jgi:hypothetical protein